MRKNKGELFQLPGWLLAVIDVVLTGCALIGFALFDHVLPARLETRISDETQRLLQAHATLSPEVEQAEEALHQKFPEKFTDGEPVWTENSYTGRNLSIALSSGRLGESVYYVQDIYLRDIGCFMTAFGQDVFGKGYTEHALEMANRKGAIGATNGDFYSMGSLGVLIRNGEIYRDEVSPLESVLALYKDGHMEIYEAGEVTMGELIDKDVWQTWSFGPRLLDENGKAMTVFEKKNPEANPRTVIGMVEPGHYMLIVVDGRQDGYSYGMTYDELAQLCEQLGLALAYNLDGGGSSEMIFGGETVSRPSDDRDVSDIIFLTDILT